MENPIEIYFATSANTGSERLFNVGLTEALEQKGYQVFLPQRDGINVNGLNQALLGRIQEYKVPRAIESAKYLLNMGLKIPKLDVILSNLDNPDNDTIIKTRYGRVLNKKVLCFKTYAQTNVNSLNKTEASEDFLTYQGDEIILAHFPATTRKTAEERLLKLAEKIDEELISKPFVRGGVPSYTEKIPFAEMIIEKARNLFREIRDINSKEGLDAIAQRIFLGEDRYLLTPKIKYLGD